MHRGSYSFVIICSSYSFSVLINSRHRFFLNYSHHISSISSRRNLVPVTCNAGQKLEVSLGLL